MLQNDATQAGSTPDARNDVDLLNQCDLGPATGNTITGQGTVSGAAGADSAGTPPAMIVAVQGASGTDSGTDGSFQVEGRYGTLTMQSDGSYSYERNAGSPDGVSDVFTYTLANEGARDTATLTINIRCEEEEEQQPEEAQQLLTRDDGVVMLPAGVELSDIRVVGRDLIITMPDGSQMIIPGGAVFVPQLVIGDVEVPPANLAALLIESEPQPAAGNPQSSGGNFAVDVAPLDPGVPLGDLIPPTELDYTPPTFEEPAQFIDDEPDIFVQPDGQPASAAAIDEVDEAGLPARDGDQQDEPEGSNAASDGETTSGRIIYDSPDGPNVIRINDVVVTEVGQVIEGEFGTLTITSIEDGEIGYTYTLSDNTSGDDTFDDFTVTITDDDGDTDTATLRINIIDDVPNAVDDVDSVSEEGPLVADGNVFTGSGGDDANSTDGAADTTGADDAEVDSFAFGSTEGTFGQPLAGAHGSLVLQADGSYTYTLNNGDADVQALGAGETLTEEFTYTIVDGDGDTSTATLTITITGANDAPTIGTAAAVVSEEGLPGGNPDDDGVPSDDTDSATASGSVDVGDVDGDDVSVTLGIPEGDFTSNGVPIEFTVSEDGHTLTGSANGETIITVTINDAGDFEVVLSGPVDHSDTSVEDELSLEIPVTVSDGTATDSGLITIGIEDDSPVVSGVVAGDSVVLDETEAGSPSGFPISATSAGAVINATTSFGGDGAGSVSYGLGLQGGGASVASGLATAIGDQPITLYQVDANTIEGRFGAGDGEVAFTITIDAETGQVTVEQNVPLEHLVDGSSAAAHDDPLDLGTLVEATVTVTDADGDTASDSAAIGDNIVFEDDGPTIDVSADADAGVVLETQDADTIGGASDSDSSSADFSGVFDAVFDGGADGAAGTPDIDYTLGVQSQGVNSGLTQTGQPIFLYLINGQVVGSTSATLAGVSDANTVFDVSVDADGVVTLTQHSQIDHPAASDPDGTDAPFDDHLVSLADGLVTLTGSATVTDNDGDTATDSATVNIGSNLQFADDGPDIDAALTGTQIRIDETDGEVAAGGEVDPVGGNLGTVTMALGSLFTISTVHASADAPTTLSYALTLSSQGVNSGLVQSASNDPIFLYNIDGTIVGSTSATLDGVADGNTVFTVSIDADGDVTLTQFQAVEHGNTGSFDEDSSGLATGALSVTVTATDFDGDTDTDSVDLGSVIRFEDDGPSIDVTASGEGAVELQTDDADTIGGASDSDSDSSSANFSGVFDFTFDGGSDGAASTPDLDFTLGLQTPGGPSGLTQGGQTIYLHLINGVVVGSTSATANAVSDANTVFEVSVNDDGVVTLTQFSQIDHPAASDPDGTDAPFADHIVSIADQLITLTATGSVTDNDGDTDSDSATVNIGANLQFTDDGPVARNDTDSTTEGGSTDGNVLTGAETTSGAAGADSPGADGFAPPPVGVVIGITSVNEGTSDTTADGSGDFELAGEWGTLTLNRDGTYTYTANPNSNPTGPDVFTYTVIDADGDTSTATLTINVGDITLTPDNETRTVNEAALDTTITGDDVAAGSVTGSNPGSTAETVTGTLTVGGAVDYQLDGTAGDVLVGTYGTIELNADGTYTYTLTQPFDSTPDANDGTNTEPGAEVFTYTATDANGNTVQGTITINIVDDVPSVDVTATGEAGVTVETDDADTIGLATDTDSSTADFSGVFDLTFVEGADGASVTPDIGYTLNVQSQGVNSGLTQGGAPIFLYSIGGAVVGSTSASLAGVSDANTVFDVTVDANGVVELTQYSQLDHPIGDDPTATESPFNDQIVSLADNLITLTGTATITDNDGDVDTDSATVNIGANLQFTDDGPNAVNDSANQATENANVTVDVFANDSAGADGVNLATGIAVVPGTLSGAGTLTYNGDGTFTYNPANNEEGTVTFDYEITDADGDTDTATVTINLRPDSNPLPVNATAAVDDEGLPNGNLGGPGDLVVAPDPDNNEATFSGTLGANFGGDAPGSFSFAAMDGDTGTVGTEDVEYSLDGNVLTATITSGARAGTDLFEVTLNPTTGVYTVRLLTNVLHADDGTNTENDATAVLTFTATDSELESANGTLTITFDDDTPTTFVTEGTDVANEAGGTGGGSLDLGDGNINNNVGADGGTVRFHPDLDGADSGLESGMQPIIYSLSPDGQTLTATAGGNTVFVVTIDQATSSYSIEMFGQIDSFTQIDFNDGSYNFVGGNEPWAGFNTLANDNSADLLLTPIVNGVSETTTNTNANSGGIDNNFVDNDANSPFEAYRLDFVTDLTGDNSGSDYEVPGNADHAFEGHYTTNGASGLIVSTTSATVRVAAFDDPDGNNVVGDGVQEDVTGVAISYNGAQSTVITSSGDVVVGGRTFTVTFNNDGTVDIDNVQGGSGPNPGGTRIAVFTDDGYNSLTFTNVGDDPFRIGDFGAAIQSSDPVPFELPVVIVDGDGDMVEGTPIEINAVAPASLTSSSATLSMESSEQQLKTMSSANSNAVFLGAVAAAGIAATPAAAGVPDFRALDLVDMADMPTLGIAPAARSFDGDVRSMLDTEMSRIVIDGRENASLQTSQGRGEAATSGLSGTESEAQAQPVMQLSQGTDSPASEALQAAPVADAVAMPSAEALAAALGGEAAADGAGKSELSRVLADALAGGQDGPNIDAVLDAVAAGNAAAEGVASPAAADVPAWDSAALAHFNGAQSAYTTDALMAHIDAPQVTSA